ncbi:MAG: hypothetical protein COB41_04440 [Proteobacteria bacterium]|nr:MAG: hypothetical protein COB41_04440 [Pseudomonadota bacterium]
MARKKYDITNQDCWFARRWIERKLENPIWLPENRTYPAKHALSRVKDGSDALNKWCELWLKKAQWLQMKNAIRAARKRARGVDTKTITLTQNAWFILDYHAQQENCTLSEVIERKLMHDIAIQNTLI